MSTELLKQIADTLERGEPEQVATLTQQALDAKLDAKVILDDGLLAGMQVIGAKFKAHEIFLPDVLLAAKAMYAGLDLIQPLLEGQSSVGRGTVVLGSVQGDLHDIGKNLVGIMLRGAGFQVIDLGHDVPATRFVDEATAHQARVVGCSTLLTTTMPVMKQVADLIRERGLDDTLKLVVGGAPVNADFAGKIGAAYGYDASSAVDVISGLAQADA